MNSLPLRSPLASGDEGFKVLPRPVSDFTESSPRPEEIARPGSWSPVLCPGLNPKTQTLKPKP
jgi:hypothetical protein